MTTPSSPKTGWFIILKPVLLCGLFILGLAAYRYHTIWIQKTNLQFSVTLPDNCSIGDLSVRMDEQPVVSGQRLPLGSHRVTVFHPKCLPWSTNIFAWYGGLDLGEIQLQRSTGKLTISATPPALSVTLSGPEVSQTMLNLESTNLVLPTDTYQVQATYAHDLVLSRQVNVLNGQPMSCPFAPALGGLSVSGTPSGISLDVFDSKGVRQISEPLPVIESGLPAGDYRLVASYRGYSKHLDTTIKAGQTNNQTFEFRFGSVQIQTEPAGATVYDLNGQALGQTPLQLDGQLVQTMHLVADLSGYERVNIAVEVQSDQTNAFQTNLISTAYVQAIQTARQLFASGNYAQAMQACREALSAKPADVEAVALLNSANGWLSLAEAKALALNGDYVGADQKLAVAQAQMPDNEEIKQLLAEYKPHEPEQIERERVNRLKRPKAIFDMIMAEYRDVSPLFEEHVLKTTKPASDVAAGIVQALQFTKPPFSVDVNRSPAPETYDIEASLELTGFLGQGTTSGRRICVIVCGQATDTESEIHYKVIEYKAETTIKFSVANLLNTATTDNVRYIPIHPSTMGPLTEKMQARINEGVSNLTAVIQGVLHR